MYRQIEKGVVAVLENKSRELIGHIHKEGKKFVAVDLDGKRFPAMAVRNEAAALLRTAA